MLCNLECLQLVEGDANRFEIQMGSQGKMAEMLLHFQTLQFEHDVQSG